MINQQAKNLKKYSNLLKELVVRDIKVRYQKSILGLLWTVLNPLLMMIITSAVFSSIFKMNIENFPVYVLIGNITFTLTSDSTSQALMSILANASLIKKVYIPKYLFPLSKILSGFVNYFFSLIALIIVMIITKSQFYPTLITIWIPLIYIFLFNFGLGLILSATNVYFRDIGHIYGVLLTAWMYLTPIFYSVDILPVQVKNIIQINPLYHYVSFFRQIVLDGTFPSIQQNLICFGYGAVVFVIGIIVFYRLQRNFILYI